MHILEIKTKLEKFLTEFNISLKTHIFDQLLISSIRFKHSYTFAKDSFGFVFSDLAEGAENINYQLPSELVASMDKSDLHALLTFLGVEIESYTGGELVVVSEVNLNKLFTKFQEILKSQSLATNKVYLLESRRAFEIQYIEKTIEAIKALIAFIVPSDHENAEKIADLSKLLKSSLEKLSSLAPDFSSLDITREIYDRFSSFEIDHIGIFTQYYMKFGNNEFQDLYGNILQYGDSFRKLYRAETKLAISIFYYQLEELAKSKGVSIFHSNIVERSLLLFSQTEGQPLDSLLNSQRDELYDIRFAIKAISDIDIHKIIDYFKSIGMTAELIETCMLYRGMRYSHAQVKVSTFAYAAFDTLPPIGYGDYSFTIDGISALEIILPVFKKAFASPSDDLNKIILSCQAITRQRQSASMLYEQLEALTSSKGISLYDSDIFELGVLVLSGVTTKPSSCHFIAGTERAPDCLKIFLHNITVADAAKIMAFLNSIDISSVQLSELTKTHGQIEGHANYMFQISGVDALDKLYPSFSAAFTSLSEELSKMMVSQQKTVVSSPLAVDRLVVHSLPRASGSVPVCEVAEAAKPGLTLSP